jgi:hypothetical protein
MTTKENVSVAVIIAIIAVFVSSSALVNPLLAQSSTDKASTSTAKTNYKDFQTCLAKGEGAKGYATEQQVKQCNGKVYGLSTSTGSGDKSDIPKGGDDSNSE